VIFAQLGKHQTSLVYSRFSQKFDRQGGIIK